MDHIPGNPTPAVLAGDLTGSQRQIFLPADGRGLTTEQEDEWIRRQIARSRASLRIKLNAAREEMGNEA